jgi:hypothetical protein
MSRPPSPYWSKRCATDQGEPRGHSRVSISRRARSRISRIRSARSVLAQMARNAALTTRRPNNLGDTGVESRPPFPPSLGSPPDGAYGRPFAFELVSPLLGYPVNALCVLLVGGCETFVLELLKCRIDRPGARPIDSAGALGQQFHQVVAGRQGSRPPNPDQLFTQESQGRLFCDPRVRSGPAPPNGPGCRDFSGAIGQNGGVCARRFPQLGNLRLTRI